MKFAFLCGCGCGAVKTFEGSTKGNTKCCSRSFESGIHIANRGADSSNANFPPEALLLAFQHLPDQELFGMVTAVCRTWQAAAATALGTRAINVHGLAPGRNAASAAAWLRRYGSHIRELHINRTEMYPEEWVAILSLPFKNLKRLEVTRSRIESAEMSLLSQLTSLQELTLNSLGKQLRVSFINRLGNSLTGLSSLELKSCGLDGEHLQGLIPLVASNLCSLDLFDNPGIGDSSESSNRALQMWVQAVKAAQAAEISPKQLVKLAGQVATSAVGNAADALTEITTVAVAGGRTAALEQEQSSAASLEQAAPAAPINSEATPAAASRITVRVEDSSRDSDSQESGQQWPQPRQPVLQALRRLQLSYCNIKHLPQLAQLTSLTSLNLQENSCDLETVEAIGQLQQLQELVLEEAVDATTVPAAFAALRGLTNLELLDLSGGPTGCLEELFGGPRQPTLGLRVKWSGKGRAPAGFRLPVRRSSGDSKCSSPRITAESVLSTTCSAPAACTCTIAAAAHRASRGSVCPTEYIAQSMHSALVSPAIGPVTPAFETGDESMTLRSPLTSAGGSGMLMYDDGMCSPLPRLRRLEAERVGLSNADISNIVRCCTQLQDLDISHNHVGTEGIVALHSLTTLTHLNISAQRPSLADTAAAALVQLKQLKGLDVGGNKFSKRCEVQLQREGSGAGGRLVRLTGCGMRSEVSEPWVTVQLERLHSKQHQQLQRDVTTPLGSPKAGSPKVQPRTKQLQREAATPFTSPRPQSTQV